MDSVVKIAFEDIQPFIRYAQYLKLSSLESPSPLDFVGSRTAFDHRLFYILDGNGIITINSKQYKAEKGMVFLLKSGTLYDMCCNENSELTVLCFNFDYTQKHSNLNMPVAPINGSLKNNSTIESIYFTNLEPLNDSLVLTKMENLESALLEIVSEYVHSRIWHTIRINSLFASVLVLIVREATISNSNTKRRSHHKTDKILKYIQQHFDEPLTNEKIGIAFNYHPNYINHLIISETGLSLHKYLLQYRIQRAIGFLQCTDMSAQEIATKVGFSDYNHFLKYFKQFTGYTTSFFR